MSYIEINNNPVKLIVGLPDQKDGIDPIGLFEFNTAVLVNIPKERPERELSDGITDFDLIKILDQEASQVFFESLIALGSEESIILLLEYNPGLIRKGKSFSSSRELEENAFHEFRVGLNLIPCIRIGRVKSEIHDWWPRK
jgi:hypothetical protein